MRARDLAGAEELLHGAPRNLARSVWNTPSAPLRNADRTHIVGLRVGRMCGAVVLGATLGARWWH